ncbi:hypothetical protein [Kushneria phyllosphaerae]|uniref:Abi-like protein n=1 Tax=Kushneria phyllosphaerae TaxID=2100822 RepID=A0A2R8CKT6_9GAMM|nr:hypothetical protein [Kushneria phyllosphaerae]SPJ33453.1 hypothetical protein KSP9073_01462 [Kushneria phyllosphaerae]
MLSALKRYEKKRLNYLYRFAAINKKSSEMPLWQYRYLSEALLSDAWQGWCLFSKDLIFNSYRGCFARDGSCVKPLVRPDYKYSRVCYEAKQCGSNPQSKIKENGHLKFLPHQEPTWGSLDFILNTVYGMGVDNSEYLASVFGSFPHLRMIQEVRNACAHKNGNIIRKLENYKTKYSIREVAHPVDYMWGREKKGRLLAFEVWLDLMGQAALLATATAK